MLQYSLFSLYSLSLSYILIYTPECSQLFSSNMSLVFHSSCKYPMNYIPLSLRHISPPSLLGPGLSSLTSVPGTAWPTENGLKQPVGGRNEELGWCHCMASCICTHSNVHSLGLFMQAVPVVSLIPYIWHSVMSNWAKDSATALGSGAAPVAWKREKECRYIQTIDYLCVCVYNVGLYLSSWHSYLTHLVL